MERKYNISYGDCRQRSRRTSAPNIVALTASRYGAPSSTIAPSHDDKCSKSESTQLEVEESDSDSMSGLQLQEEKDELSDGTPLLRMDLTTSTIGFRDEITGEWHEVDDFSVTRQQLAKNKQRARELDERAQEALEELQHFRRSSLCDSVVCIRPDIANDTASPTQETLDLSDPLVMEQRKRETVRISGTVSRLCAQQIAAVWNFASHQDEREIDFTDPQKKICAQAVERMDKAVAIFADHFTLEQMQPWKVLGMDPTCPISDMVPRFHYLQELLRVSPVDSDMFTAAALVQVVVAFRLIVADTHGSGALLTKLRNKPTLAVNAGIADPDSEKTASEASLSPQARQQNDDQCCNSTTRNSDC